MSNIAPFAGPARSLMPGLPSAARDARYDLLTRAARRHGALHVFTAHTRDDQAETVIMRLSRGSGLAGLAAMARQSGRGDVILVRPFLDVPKSRLVATLKKEGIAFAEDPPTMIRVSLARGCAR